MEKPSTIKEVKGSAVSWINVEATTPTEVDYLQELFHFHSLDLKDCLPPTQRPKLVVRPHYIFMILLFPLFDRVTRKIKPVEVDFFINGNTLVTVHERNLPPLMELFEALSSGKTPELLENSPANLLYEILEALTLYCFPILVHISNDIDQVEEHILDAEYHAASHRAQEILRIKTNIANFRKAIRPLKYVIEKLVGTAPQFFSVVRLNIFFADVVDRTREIWDMLENYKDSTDALHESNESLLVSSTNAIMKTLAAFAVVFIPATVIGSLFSTSFKFFPFADSRAGFWVMVLLMIAAVGGFFAYFKKKQWL